MSRPKNKTVEKQIIAVISENINDFRSEIIKLFGDYSFDRRSNGRRVITDKATYFCITKAIHLCGVSFHDAITTENAYRNEEIPQIIYNIKPTFYYPLGEGKAAELTELFNKLESDNKFKNK